MRGKIHLLYYDPTHQIHNTIIGKCWQGIGEKNTIRIPSNTGRSRISVLGAVNAVSTQFTGIITEDNCDKEMNEIVLEEIRKDYPDGKKIVIILDNASYNRAYCVKDKAEELNMELLFLPPYSPNLSLIERVWKFLKNTLKNTYFPTLQDFKSAIFDFCANFEKYADNIKRLLSQKFEII
jgi:transposase